MLRQSSCIFLISDALLKLKDLEQAAKYREELERKTDQGYHHIHTDDINEFWGRCKKAIEKVANKNSEKIIECKMETKMV